MVVMPKGRFFLLPATFFFKSASNEETSKLQHYEFTVVLLYNICCGGDCSAFGFRQVQNPSGCVTSYSLSFIPLHAGEFMTLYSRQNKFSFTTWWDFFRRSHIVRPSMENETFPDSRSRMKITPAWQP